MRKEAAAQRAAFAPRAEERERLRVCFVVRAVRSAFAGGIAYAFTAFLGVALLFSWSFLRMAIGPEHPLLGLIAGVGVAYTLGVQGYLMGRLVDLKGGLGSS